MWLYEPFVLAYTQRQKRIQIQQRSALGQKNQSLGL
jgi:hypothetical protein